MPRQSAASVSNLSFIPISSSLSKDVVCTRIEEKGATERGGGEKKGKGRGCE